MGGAIGAQLTHLQGSCQLLHFRRTGPLQTDRIQAQLFRQSVELAESCFPSSLPGIAFEDGTPSKSAAAATAASATFAATSKFAAAAAAASATFAATSPARPSCHPLRAIPRV